MRTAAEGKIDRRDAGHEKKVLEVGVTLKFAFRS
jgi:hypothetical protein